MPESVSIFFINNNRKSGYSLSGISSYVTGVSKITGDYTSFFTSYWIASSYNAA
jgi:hypothetical protein